MTRPVLRTKLCDMLGIEYPILLAGMGSRGRATPPELVAAVSEAGGLGMVGGSNLEPETIRGIIRRIRSLTNKPFGVDLLLPGNLSARAGPTRTAVRAQLEQDYPRHWSFMRDLLERLGVPYTPFPEEIVVSPESMRAQVEVVLEEAPAVFAAGLGDPSWVTPRAHEAGMTVIGLAGTVRNAEKHVAAGCDIVVAQGYEAGGHTGQVASFPLIPQVVDAVAPRPVLAAGGIADGRGVAAALTLGAAGVWVGTAFLVSEESGISDAQKEQILGGRSQDFQIQRYYSGKTMRAFRNPAVAAWQESGLEPLPMPFQKVLMDDFNESAIAADRTDLHSNPAGQIGGMLTRRRPAAEIMRDLVEGTIRVLDERPRIVITAQSAITARPAE